MTLCPLPREHSTRVHFKFASAPLNGLSNFTFSADFTPSSIGWARTSMDAAADSATCEANRKHVVGESVQALFAPRVRPPTEVLRSNCPAFAPSAAVQVPIEDDHAMIGIMPGIQLLRPREINLLQRRNVRFIADRWSTSRNRQHRRQAREL